MLFPNARIIIFARAPIPGQCKTRLIPAIGAQAAAELHARLLWQTLTTATQARLCQVELWCADQPEHAFFKHCQQHFAVSLKQQQGANLGERMNHAFTQTLTKAERAILIGCDCPALQPSDLAQALSVLEQHDCVLKPAADGGYVLIGLNNADARIFQDVDWGSSHVLRQTRQQLKKQKTNWLELATTWDLDRPEDLLKFKQLELNNLHNLPLIFA